MPSNQASAQAALALMDQLIRALTAKGVLSEGETRDIISASVDDLKRHRTTSGEEAATFLKERFQK